MKIIMAFICTIASLAVLPLASPNDVRAQAPRELPDRQIDAAIRTQVIEAALKRLSDYYVFPERATGIEQAVRERVKNKEYEQITSAKEFARKLTADLQAVSRDKHLSVFYFHRGAPPDERQEPTPEQRERQRQVAGRVNFGFEKVERLAGNIGYMDFRGFIDPELGADTVAAAFNFIANTDALIIDLRQNRGGDPAMVALICSYLFGSEPIHLNDLYWREGNRTEQFWTRKEVAGRRYTGKDVYVLTSNRTFSGAEEFSYNLKNLKRAAIIGETTGGGAHPGRGVRLGEHFGMFLPTGRAINPITKTNWEGTGVEPDVKAPAGQALKVAHLAALRKGMGKVADPELKGEYQRQIETLQKELDEMQSKVSENKK